MNPSAAPAPIASPVPAAPPAFEPLVIDADGTPIAMRYYAPRAPARGAVLIVSAMGVPQSYYAAFATWLAGAGFHAATFDYRGMGESRTTRLRDVDADVVTWAEHDTAAALRQLSARARGLPITWIGHSLGGQIVPFVPGHERVAKLVTIATGSGYWRENTPALKRKVWILWWGAVPILTPLFGYFPGRSLGIVGDLPRGVIRQWRRWCLDPEYAVGAEGPAVRERFARVAVPLTAISFTDDEMMSAASIESIHGFYTGSSKTMLRLDPRDAGLSRIGHFGWFRAEMREPLWERVLAPELAVLERTSGRADERLDGHGAGTRKPG